MPTRVDFHLPFQAPVTRPSEVERARLRTVDWAREHGLLKPTDESVRYFLSMRLADVATGFSPDARGADLDVMTDLITWTAVCDDFFDGPVGDDPARAMAAVTELARVTTGAAGATAAHPGNPLVSATADLWARMAEPMSDRWRLRAGRNWRRFLLSFLAEADARRARRIPTVTEYFRLRQETMAMYVYLDAAERSDHREVPEAVLSSEAVRELLALEIEILACCNDVHSVEHEEARGDTHNLVLVLERREGLSRDDAIERIRGWVHERSERFLAVRAGLPRLWAALGLTPAERAAAEAHVTTMTHQMRVTYDWSRATARYTAPAPVTAAAEATRPPYLAFAQPAVPAVPGGRGR
ncbi:hypothetical protein ACIRVF_22805 [Kitasatospora sp. NPDC101157]|uniref:terpene synthase family protein n=1 Tax=Kitasatospora sp. NPDC101157 TaxID=3364098 RepID=UPI00380FE5A8